MKTIDEKQCLCCRKIKSINFFWKNKKTKDGLTIYCIKCRKKYYQSVKERCYEYFKRYRVKNREWLNKRYKSKQKKYYKLNKNKLNKQSIKRQLLARKTKEGRKKYNAHQVLNYHIRVGNIKRQSCMECGAKHSQAHHYNGYEKENQLNIIWLCAKCHGKRHYKIYPFQRKNSKEFFYYKNNKNNKIY